MHGVLFALYYMKRSEEEEEEKKNNSMESRIRVFDHSKPFLAMILMQSGYAVMSIIAKFALNEGMSPHVLVAYRLAVASVLITPFAIVLERKSRPKMTLTIFVKIMLVSLLEPVLDQNCFYTGMEYTTATFTAAMCNILPALTFALACVFKLERVEIRKVHSIAKVVGTMVSVGGAMVMTLIKGHVLDFPWTKGPGHHSGQPDASGAHKQNLVMGALLMIAGCCCWSCFIIAQATILKSYPAKLSFTAILCIMGTLESTILAFVVERHNTSVWQVHWDIKLISSLYGGVVSALALYTMGCVMKKRGPVFVSAFNPLGMVIVSILGSFFLAEETYIGRVIGSIVIVIGLYLVLWGKSKDQPRSTSDVTVVLDDAHQMATVNDHVENLDPELITIER